MQEQLIEFLTSLGKKFGPYILGGAIGSIIHRLRTNMSLKEFIGSVIISMFVGLSVGILAKDYLQISDTIIFVLCSISGTFSKLILAEVEEIIKDISVFVRIKLGINNVNRDEENNNNTF